MEIKVIRKRFKDILWRVRWKYGLKNRVWRRHVKAFYDDKNIQARFWIWLYNRLIGQFTVITKYGEFGIDYHGFFNFDMYVGNLCRITFFWCRDAKTILVSFLRRYYKDTVFTEGKGRAYFAYMFGHELRSHYENGKFIYYSAWRWGRYLPWASDVNIKKTGKIFKKIGYGKSRKKDPLFVFKVPPFTWITSEYAEKNAWVVCSCDKDKTCQGGECEYLVRSGKVIPCFPKSFLRPGDILIYFDYEESERFEEVGKISFYDKEIPLIIDHGKEVEELDRYQVITEEFLEMWDEEGLGSPEAVVVRAPDKPGPKRKRDIKRILKRVLKKHLFL